MRIAGFFLLLSAALHVVGTVLSGFAPEGMFLLGPAVLYVLLALGLLRGMRWLNWITLVVMLVGSAGAISTYFAPGAVPPWVFLAILAADLAAALALFGAIWVGRPKAAA